MLALISTALAASALVAAKSPAARPTPAPVVPRQNDAHTVYTYTGTSPLPLTDYEIPYTAIPFQVNPYAFSRGPQSGYNQCNSTTEGPDSMCQTLMFNSFSDFCIWGMPGQYPNYQNVSDEEAAMVAYCTLAGHGTRILPPGTITAAQMLVTDAYIEIIGTYQQNATDETPSDSGGEEDPHGADNLGNPLGSLVYSTNFTGGNGEPVQVNSWNGFFGSGQFCMKMCNPNYSTDLNYCLNVYDLLGCAYNMPANYSQLQPGFFEVCDSDLQDIVGTYTNSAGQTMTYTQQTPEPNTLPFTARVPSSSNCVAYKSTDLWPVSSLGYQSTNSMFLQGAALPTGSGSASGSKTGSGTGSHSASRTTAAGTKSTGGSGAGATGSAGSAAGAAVSSTGKSSGAASQAPAGGAKLAAGLTVGGALVGALALFL